MPAQDRKPSPEPEALAPEDQRFVIEWAGAMGDEASSRSVRARVTRLLALRDAHPERPSLEALLEDPYVRAVMFAPPNARRSANERLRRHLARLRGDGGSPDGAKVAGAFRSRP